MIILMSNQILSDHFENTHLCSCTPKKDTASTGITKETADGVESAGLVIAAKHIVQFTVLQQNIVIELVDYLSRDDLDTPYM